MRLDPDIPSGSGLLVFPDIVFRCRNACIDRSNESILAWCDREKMPECIKKNGIVNANILTIY
jgi:hypothetical protein